MQRPPTQAAYPSSHGKRTIRAKRTSRKWRRGNGFEPPSRAVHTRALPIELPCRAKRLPRLSLSLVSLANGRASWLIAASGDLVPVLSASALALYFLGHHDQSARHFFV